MILTKKIFLSFYSLFYLTLSAHAQIKISEWVVPPPATDMQKPLIYIDFWATWCAPCVSSIPHTEGLRQKFGKDILFLYISKEPQSKQASFMNKRRLHFIAGVDFDGNTHNFFHVNAIPYAVILGPRGKILWQGKPSELNERILQSLTQKFARYKGDPGRIQLVKNHFSGPKPQFKSMVVSNRTWDYRFYDEPVSFACNQKNDLHICKGRLDKILAHLLKIKPFQIQFASPFPYMEWKIPSGDITENEILDFLQKLGYRTKIDTKEQDVYILTAHTNENWFNSQIYSYSENGEPLAFADDNFLIIDNATPGQMANYLTQFTSTVFIYKGDDKNPYDWNINISNKKELIMFLIGELDFDIRKTTQNIKILKLEK